MIIIATTETINTGAFTTAQVDCEDYATGFQQLHSSVPEGQRLINVRVQRS